jgi:hypothetical protein
MLFFIRGVFNMGVETAVGFAAVSTLAQLAGQRSARNAANSAARSAGMAEADYLEDQATQTEIAGQREVFVRGIEGGEIIGAQTSSFADNGVNISGSALKQLAVSKAKLSQELDAMAFDTRFKASMIRKRASAFRSGALQSRGGGGMEDAATLIGGAANIASMFSGGIGSGGGGTSGPIAIDPDAMGGW